MRFEQLRYLAASVRNGSFRRAAGELGLAQPSLTQAIQKLEDELQATILQRGRTGIHLTAVGEAILPHVLQALECEARMRQEANEHFELAKGGLNVGTVHAGSVTFLPRVLPRFCGRHPGISIQVREAGSCSIAEEVRSRHVDIGLVTCMEDVSPNLSGLSYADLVESKLVLCVPRHHPLTRRRKGVTVDDFADEPLIVFPPGYSMHDVMRKLFEGRQMHVPYHTNNPESATRMVAAGIGVTAFPEVTVAGKQFPQDGQVAYLRILDDIAVVRLRAIRRTDEWVSRPAEIFWEMLQSEAIGNTYQPGC
jgi:DNA-binding transcriptional LysR family regulator